jgi:transcriptional regulator with XRE-family HTH domain
MEPAVLLKTVRRRRGLTQVQLAARAGTSQPVVSAYERGRRDPTFSTLRRLIEATGERLELGARVDSGALPPARDVHERAARLLDVLSFADAVPTRPRSATLDAPRLVSR